MMSGRGSLTLANGERYVGEFRNDVFQGQGRYTFPDGDSYEGAFERGRFHGQGTMTRVASVYRGEFRNGEFLTISVLDRRACSEGAHPVL